MTAVAALLEQLAGEPLHLVQHPTGRCRYTPTDDPAISPNAGLWRARGAAGWLPTPEEAAIALAFVLGLEQGRQEAAPEVRVVGKIEREIIACVGMLTAVGTPATEDTIIAAVVAKLPLAAGPRDRRREAVRRAFAGLATRTALVAAGEDAATRTWQVASRSAT
jgi:hypothetical protein